MDSVDHVLEQRPRDPHGCGGSLPGNITRFCIYLLRGEGDWMTSVGDVLLEELRVKSPELVIGLSPPCI